MRMSWANEYLGLDILGVSPTLDFPQDFSRNDQLPHKISQGARSRGYGHDNLTSRAQIAFIDRNLFKKENLLTYRPFRLTENNLGEVYR